jgi:ketosteroid isomerase-like protein
MSPSIHLRNLATTVAALSLTMSQLVFAASTAPPAAAKPAAAKPAPPAAPESKPKLSMSVAECAVWDRERSFAASVEHHDIAAFAEHLHAKAVFDAGSTEPTHGRDAIVASWKGIIDGKTVKLGWSPNVVTIGGDGNLAVSRGPDWIEDPRPNAKQRYQIGEFNSIWIRDADGQWRVLFDDGDAAPHAASADDVAKLVASLPKECPHN